MVLNRPAQSMPTGLAAFQLRRKADTRGRLMEAAGKAFCERGYVPVSVDEITLAAGVSRMTFYRHFSGKAEIATELFRQNARAHLPLITAIARRNFRERAVVRDWIGEIFAVDATQHAILQAFMQANVIEASFAREGHAYIDTIIRLLGEGIAAFDFDSAVASDRRHVEAALLIYELLDQSNHAARRTALAADDLLVEVLTDRFLAFVGQDHGA